MFIEYKLIIFFIFHFKLQVYCYFRFFWGLHSHCRLWKLQRKCMLPLQSTMGLISKVCLIMSGSSQTFFKYLRLVFTFVDEWDTVGRIIKNEILYGLKKTENYKKWRRKRKMKNSNCFFIYAMNFKLCIKNFNFSWLWRYNCFCPTFIT